MKRFFLSAVLPLLFGLSARGDVLQFKNGDQLTGKWEQVLHVSLKFNAESVGAVTVPLDKVKSFSASKPAVIILKSRQTLRGRLSLLPSGEWEVVSESGSKSLPEQSVEAIYPESVYEPRSPEHTAMPWQNWHGASNAGYSLVRGDRKASILSLGVNATHKSPDLPEFTERWRTNFALNGLASSSQSSPQNRVTADSVSSGLRQDLLFTSNNFLFALSQFDHIQAQNLNLRQTYGAGFGRDMERSVGTLVSVLGGTTLVTEQFKGGTRRQNFEGLIGEKIGLGLNGRVHLQHVLSFYPNLTDEGQYRLETITTISTRLFSHWSLDTSLADRFVSRPLIATIQKNEVTFTTGFGFNF